MNGCNCENWTLQALSDALQNMHKDNKRIVVPMFQRGKRWDKDKEQTFIDSLKKGYPVGTMLFYEKMEDGQQTYILVDGLQRSNCIRKYINNPTEFINTGSIPEKEYGEVMVAMGMSIDDDMSNVKDKLSVFIKEQKSFKDIQYFNVAKNIVESYGVDFSKIGDVINVIDKIFRERREHYEQIASSIIPVLVYSGDENNLPEIFDRINSQGEPLDPYEIFAASWPINEKFPISNTEILEAVIKKYDVLANDGYIMHGYNREVLRTTREVNAFEYIFGLSKYLVNKYEILRFNSSLADDTVNPLAFELLNACLHESNKMPFLYKKFHKGLNVDQFERALLKAIDFVEKSVSPITRFKGNKRNKQNAERKFHAKYQILSMISTTFKEMFAEGNYEKYSQDWELKKTALSQNLFHYYIYDILTNYWKEGGTGKIFQVARPNRYMAEISDRAWMVAIDGYFETLMQRKEGVNGRPVRSPGNEEYVVLNCIYLNSFTAMDQLSLDKFDVEHIAPKKQMEKLIEVCRGDGLPISSIANLCYLPESANRSKGAKNFYQDKKYLSKINIGIDELEAKYSFTQFDDLEWMDAPYENPNDYQVLKNYYIEFCNKRFDKMKHLLCDSLGIEYVELKSNEEDSSIISDEIDTTGYHDFRLTLSKEVNAIMRYYPIGKRFVIQSGSKVRFAESDDMHNQFISQLRANVFADEKKARIKGNIVILLEDIEIRRPYPSPAACFCTGTSMQGTTAWKDINDKKRTFEDLFPKSKSGEEDTNSQNEDYLPIINKTDFAGGNFPEKCANRLANSIDATLLKLNRSTYKTEDGKKGYVVVTSKAYPQGEREKFWFAYRRKEEIKDCEEQYYIFGCKDEKTMIKMPVSELESHLDALNTSVDEDGNAKHWHIVFLKDKEGQINWLLSKPEIREVEVTEKLL